MDRLAPHDLRRTCARLCHGWRRRRTDSISCSVTLQSKRRNGTLGADRSSKMRSTIGSKYHWQVGRDNPVYHVGDEARLGSAQNQEICKVLCPHCSVSASAIMYSPSSVFPSENEWTPTRCLLPMCDEIHTSTFLPDGEPVQWLVFARSSASRLFWKAGSSSDE